MSAMTSDNRKVLWLAVGVISGVGTAYCVSELRRLLRQKCTRPPFSSLEDAIRLEDLEILTRSPNIALKRSAEQLLLDRAMRKTNLEFIINACACSDEEQVLKGITVLGVLVKTTEYHRKLVYRGALETLAYCLSYSVDSGYPELVAKGGLDTKVQRIAASALFDLVCDEDSLKSRLGKGSPHVVPTILKLMTESSSKEVMRWCIFLAHQLSLCDVARPALVDNGAIGIVSQMVVRSQGDNVLMRLCLQMLVMCANTTEEEEILALHEMASHNIIRPTVVCLKADDSDLVYWAAALIHEYSVKDLYKTQICSVPNVVKLLQGVLSTSESILQRIVLRVISFLCVGNQEFRTSVLGSHALMTRLQVCYASGDKDVVHWAVVLLHDLLLSTGSSSVQCKNAAEKVINASEGIIKALSSLACHKDKILIRLVAEIIGFFCSVDFPSEKLQSHIVHDGALEAILAFSQSADSDLQYWSTALLLNLSMTSDRVKEEIIKLGGVKMLIELAISDSDHSSVATQSAKTLVMLGFVDNQVHTTIKGGSLQHGNYMSISIDGKEYCCNKQGINIVALDIVTFKVSHCLSYDMGQDPLAVSKMAEELSSIPTGHLVFVAVRGEMNYYITDEALEAFKEIGIGDYNFKTGELWAYIGQKKIDKVGDQIAIHKNYDHVLLETGISLGRFVNGIVQSNILAPVIDLMVSTPPSSPISKVAELELLTIMARHDDHKHVMVSFPGFLEYMAELIWNVASKTAGYLRENPMVIAHCIGALKIVSGISINDQFQDALLSSGVLNAVLTLLHFVNSLALIKVNQQHEMMSPPLSPQRYPSSVDEEETQTDNAKSDQANHPRNSIATATSGYDDISFDERKTLVGQSESSSDPDEFEDAFSSIIRLSVTVMYNCMGMFSIEEMTSDSLIKSGTLHTLWATLLTSNEPTLAQIGLPVEVLLNNFGCIASEDRSLQDNVMELDERIKTPALVLSADHLEAYNMNWTFESIRATHCVGHTMYKSSPHPSGWYFEVTLKSNGILQIGWQTEECRYGPEKGVGVGDDSHSCAFDGARCKVWSGPPCEQHSNDYGTEWQDGDVLSCLLSWDGDVSFWVNGTDHGVAFRSLNTAVNWYPAASLAMDQHCIFNFGSKTFRYEMPSEFVAVNQVTNYPRKQPVRPVLCWTALSGSFESIVEEEEEEGDDGSVSKGSSSIFGREDSPLSSPNEIVRVDLEEKRAVVPGEEKGPSVPAFMHTPEVDMEEERKPAVTGDSEEKRAVVPGEEKGPSVPALMHTPEEDVEEERKPAVTGDDPLTLEEEVTCNAPSDIPRSPSTIDDPPSTTQTTPNTMIDACAEEVESDRALVFPHGTTFTWPSTPTLENTKSHVLGDYKGNEGPTNEPNPSMAVDAPPEERPALSVYDVLSPSGVRREPCGFLSTPIPVQPFSPGEMVSTESGNPSFPCLYFEAELKCSPCKIKQVGFFNSQTGEKLYCDLRDGQLYLPITSTQPSATQECYKSPDVVGCGILWPAGVVIFTLDGVGTGDYYELSAKKSNIQNLLPYVSCSRIRCNYGQREFLFEHANFKEVCYAGANVLHGHGLSDQVLYSGKWAFRYLSLLSPRGKIIT